VAGIGSIDDTGGEQVTFQSKDREGRANAMAFYADDPAAPTTLITVTAGRVKNLGTDRITESTTTTGKVTCTDNVDAGTLLAQAGPTTASTTAVMRRMTTASACWRTGRHLTVLVVAFTAHEAAQSTARRAVMDSWDAI
jgi:hypothetical protein